MRRSIPPTLSSIPPILSSIPPILSSILLILSSRRAWPDFRSVTLTTSQPKAPKKATSIATAIGWRVRSPGSRWGHRSARICANSGLAPACCSSLRVTAMSVYLSVSPTVHYYTMMPVLPAAAIHSGFTSGSHLAGCDQARGRQLQRSHQLENKTRVGISKVKQANIPEIRLVTQTSTEVAVPVLLRACPGLRGKDLHALSGKAVEDGAGSKGQPDGSRPRPAVNQEEMATAAIRHCGVMVSFRRQPDRKSNLTAAARRWPSCLFSTVPERRVSSRDRSPSRPRRRYSRILPRGLLHSGRLA